MLLVLVGRAGERIVPQGSTVLRAGDRLLLAADGDGLETTRWLLSGE